MRKMPHHQASCMHGAQWALVSMKSDDGNAWPIEERKGEGLITGSSD
jgi:hypothetical protein